MKSKVLCFIAVVTLLASCGTVENVSYFNDIHNGTYKKQAVEATDICVRPDDKISILVNSRDPQLSDLFNLPVVSRQLGTASRSGGGSSTAQGISAYTVDANGEIDFPILGKIKVEGMTRTKIAEKIKQQLIAQNMVKDPVVTVEFQNLCISVMGEVNNPGRYSIDRDKLTLLDALSMAGDMTIYGKRENVTVLRMEDGEQQAYTVNLCSASELMSSPVFYMRQNDVVYVEPNDTKVRQSTVNGNTVRSTSFWISLASLITSIAVLVVK